MKIAAIIEAFEKDKNLKVLFFFDPEGANQEELMAADLQGIRVEIPSQGAVQEKLRILETAEEGKMLLYFPHPRPVGKAWEQFSLRGLYHANKEISFDEITEFLDEFGLPEGKRSLVTDYIDFLKRGKYQKIFATILDSESLSESQIKQGLIGSALGAESFLKREESIIRMLLLAHSPPKAEEFIQRVERWDLEEELMKWFERFFDWSPLTVTVDTLVEASARFKYFVITRDLKDDDENDHYKQLKVHNRQARNRTYAVLTEWQKHPRLSGELEDFLGKVDSVKEEKVIEWYGIDVAVGYETKKILALKVSRVLTLVEENPFKAGELLTKWRNQLAPDHVMKGTIGFAWHAIRMITILHGFPSFRFPSIVGYWEKYATELHEVDFHYRKAFFELYEGGQYEIDGLNQFCKLIDAKYQRFLIDLNNGWLELLNQHDFKLRDHITGHQSNFFQQEVKTLEVKGVVIISDAFRYEVGKEFETRLLTDARNEVSIKPMLASVPSITKLGMAQLLPHETIAVSLSGNTMGLSLDDGSAEGTESRRAILRRANERSDVITYAEMKDWDRDTGREYFKAHDLVYIYHDHIDAVSDMRKTEDKTFDAVDTAVEELEALVSKLTNSWNRRKVLITSDHGFLYNRKNIEEDMKEDIPELTSAAVVSQRYILSEKGESAINGFRFPLANVAPLHTDLTVIIPRSINRFKKKGAGKKFVHGGVSLQEIMVPMISVTRKREDKGEKVGVRLIPEKKIMTTAILKVKVLQEQKVDNRVRPREIVIGLYSDGGKQLCDEKFMLLESPSSLPRDRAFDIILQLAGEATSNTFCLLRAFDLEDSTRLNPLIEERVIINLLYDKDEF